VWGSFAMDDDNFQDQREGKLRAVPPEFRNVIPRPLKIRFRPFAFAFVSAFVLAALYYFYCRFTISLPTGKYAMYVIVELLRACAAS
jgi:hypothetical protein